MSSRRIHTWRATTFEALARAAIGAEGRWPGYSAFARLQEKGLRKDALKAVTELAAEMSGRSIAARWELVRWLAGELARSDAVLEALVPHPLQVALVLPTLRELRHEEPGAGEVPPSPEPFLLMVRHFKPAIHAEDPTSPDPVGGVLRKGLARFPSEPRLERALAMHLLGLVEDNGHHLFESRYLGVPEEDLLRLAEARGLLGDPADPLRAELDRLEALLSAWCACRAAGASDFTVWCREHGIAPPTGHAFYYDTR